MRTAVDIVRGATARSLAAKAAAPAPVEAPGSSAVPPHSAGDLRDGAAGLPAGAAFAPLRTIDGGEASGGSGSAGSWGAGSPSWVVGSAMNGARSDPGAAQLQQQQQQQRAPLPAPAPSAPPIADDDDLTLVCTASELAEMAALRRRVCSCYAAVLMRFMQLEAPDSLEALQRLVDDPDGGHVTLGYGREWESLVAKMAHLQPPMRESKVRGGSICYEGVGAGKIGGNPRPSMPGFP